VYRSFVPFAQLAKLSAGSKLDILAPLAQIFRGSSGRVVARA
jgi:hypothetical protein